MSETLFDPDPSGVDVACASKGMNFLNGRSKIAAAYQSLMLSRQQTMAQARILKPTKSAMQSGKAGTRHWVLEYGQVTPREPDPLMGWTSVDDTLNQVRLRFDTLEEAVAFAKKQGLDYTVIEPQEPIFKPKSYADNFRYDRPR